MNDLQEEVYKQGYVSFYNDVSRSDNPYKGSHADLWDEGWCISCKDYTGEY